MKFIQIVSIITFLSNYFMKLFLALVNAFTWAQNHLQAVLSSLYSFGTLPGQW